MRRFLVIPLLVVLAVLMPVSSISSQQVQIDTVAGPVQLVAHNPTAYVSSFCFDNGWQVLLDEELNSFENQGQCVAHVQHGGKLVQWFPDFPLIGDSFYVEIGVESNPISFSPFTVIVYTATGPILEVAGSVHMVNNIVQVELAFLDADGQILGSAELTESEFSSLLTVLLRAEDGETVVLALEDVGLPPISLP